MRGRIFLLLMAVIAAIACGVSVVGGIEDAASTNDGGGVDGASTDGATATDAPAPPPPINAFEAGIDASPTNCEVACGDAGTCDGGWCVIDCDGPRCKDNLVVCPPGIPCEVQCKGKDSCQAGVACANASACNVACDGDGTCANAKTTCSGVACQITCSKANSCISGVECDAGTCVLRCLDDHSCQNSPVICNSERCSVECGTTNAIGVMSCLASVECRATVSCDVRCLSDDTCKNNPVIAIAGQTASVLCARKDGCASQVIVGAGDASVQCLGTNTCPNGVVCDGGHCVGECAVSDSHLCCTNPDACETKQTTSCVMAKQCP